MTTSAQTSAPTYGRTLLHAAPAVRPRPELPSGFHGATTSVYAVSVGLVIVLAGLALVAAEDSGACTSGLLFALVVLGFFREAGPMMFATYLCLSAASVGLLGGVVLVIARELDGPVVSPTVS